VRARIQGLYSTVGLIGAFVGSDLFIPLYLINFRFPWFMMGLCYGLCILVGGLIIRRQETKNLPRSQVLQEDQAKAATLETSSHL
jgi:hypothetical protein